MHRSGTSALSGVLGLLGVNLSNSMRAPHPGVNEKGYWEHFELVQLHDRLFSGMHYSWDEILSMPEAWWKQERVAPFRREIVRILERDFSTVPVWGFKDPRLCRLLPLWLEILDDLGIETRFVLTYRHPLEVARSLQRRNDFRVAKSGLLWLDHNLSAERWTRGRPRWFTSFGRLLEDPVSTVAEMQRALEIPFPRSCQEAEGEIRDFLSPDLRHHDAGSSEAWGEFGAAGSLVRDCARILERSCRTDGREFVAEFDRLGRDYAGLLASFDPALTGHILDLRRHVGGLEDYLRDLHGSLPWKIAWPVRRIARLLRGGPRRA
jgi:hypothetical protein